MTPKYLIFPFVCSLVICLLLAWAAPWLRLMDHPDARKQHGRDVPVVGGIAIMLAYLLALKLRGLGGNLAEVFLPVGLMLAVGVVDDAYGVPARFKLALQIVAAWLLVKATGFELTSIPVPGWESGLPLGVFAVPVTVVVFVAIMNAINMSDGADGLAGGYVVMAAFFYMTIASFNRQPVTVLLLWGLISAVLGFLACNMRRPWLNRAIVFMGDAGALTLGVLLCWFGVTLSRAAPAATPPVLMLYAVALPLLDMVTVAVRRVLRGENPMRADRTHLHHLLCLRGLSIELSVPLLWASHLLVSAMGLIMWQMGMSAGFLLFVFIILLIVKMLYLRVWEAVVPEPDEQASSSPQVSSDSGTGTDSSHSDH